MEITFKIGMWGVQFAGMKYAHIRELIDLDHAPANNLLVVVHLEQDPLTTRTQHLELVAGNLPPGRIAGQRQEMCAILPSAIYELGINEQELH